MKNDLKNDTKNLVFFYIKFKILQIKWIKNKNKKNTKIIIEKQPAANTLVYQLRIKTELRMRMRRPWRTVPMTSSINRDITHQHMSALFSLSPHWSLNAAWLTHSESHYNFPWLNEWVTCSNPPEDRRTHRHMLPRTLQMLIS